MFLRSLFFAVLFAGTSAMSLAADTMLVMVEEKGCIWCAHWNQEIAQIYPKTAEGAAAPLARIDIRENRPEGLVFARSLNFTPTFVLVIDGKEVSRIEGYPGEAFFWGLLGKMLADAKVDVTG